MNFWKFKVPFSEIIEEKNTIINVSIVTALRKVISYLIISVSKLLPKKSGRRRLLRETLTISSKTFLPIPERIYCKFSKTIVPDLRTYFLVNNLWAIRRYLNLKVPKRAPVNILIVTYRFGKENLKVRNPFLRI